MKMIGFIIDSPAMGPNKLSDDEYVSATDDDDIVEPTFLLIMEK